MQSSEELYKQWICTHEEWNEYLTFKNKGKKKTNKFLYITILIIGVVIGVALSVKTEDILFLYIMLGLIIFLTIPAFLFPIIDKMLMPKYGNIALAPNAVYISGRLYNWNMATAKLNSVSIVKEKKQTYICFVYTYITLTIVGIDTIYVPVTKSMLNETDSIIEFYKKQIK